MKCYICDCEDSSITIDNRDGKYGPCKTCQEVITETVLSFGAENEDEHEVVVDTDFDDNTIPEHYSLDNEP